MTNPNCLFRVRNGLFITVLLAAIHFGANVQAQIADRPKTGPDQKKMEIWAGTWTYEGTLHDSPLGPGGTFRGRETIRWIMDGLMQESRGKDTGVYGGKKMTYEGLQVRWFDAVTGKYRSRSFDNDGVIGESEDSPDGRVWSAKGQGMDSKGRRSLSRGTTTFSADGKTRVSKFELSLDDGKTWFPLWELTAKKR